MRTLFCILLLAVCACTLHARKTDEQILAGMDDASAAEARWLLASDRFAPDVVGDAGVETREGRTLARLTTAGDVKVFELLADSTRATAAAYGLAGIAKLAPDRLSHYLPQVVTVRETFEWDSGCICITDATLLHVCFGLASLNKISLERDDLSSAWKSWLDEIADHGAFAGSGTLVDFVAAAGTELLEKKDGLTDRQLSVLAYMRAMKSDDPIDSLLSLLRDPQTSKLTRMCCLEYFERFLPLDYTDSPEGWIRTGLYVDDKDRVRKSGIIPQLIIHLWEMQKSWLTFGDPMWWENPGVKPFLTLPDTTEVGKLRECTDAAVRAAAKEAWDSMLANGELGNEPPREPVSRYIWFTRKFSLASESASVRKQLRELLRSDGVDMAWTPAGYNSAALASVLVETTPVDEIDKLTSIAIELTKLEEQTDHLMGWHILNQLALNKDKWKLAAEVEGMPEVILGALEQAGESGIWNLRMVALDLAENTQSLRAAIVKQRFNYRAKWLKSLAVELATHPRSVPPFAELPWKWHGGDTPSAVLIERLYDGAEWFTPKTPEEEEGGATLKQLLQRMKEAAAEVDD